MSLEMDDDLNRIADKGMRDGVFDVKEFMKDFADPDKREKRFKDHWRMLNAAMMADIWREFGGRFGEELDMGVVEAMLEVPRHKHVREDMPNELFRFVYSHDKALPLNGLSEGVSGSNGIRASFVRQPLEVAAQAHWVRKELISSGKLSGKFVHVDCESGYLLRVIEEMRMFGDVVGVEHDPEVASIASRALRRNQAVEVVVDEAPVDWVVNKEKDVDVMVVSAATSSSKASRLARVLSDGGVMIVPVSNGEIVEMVKYVRRGDEVIREWLPGKWKFVRLQG